MKFAVLVFTILVALTSSSAIYPIYGVTVGVTPFAHPVQSLYHAQDIHGQYVYGYATPTATKTETKSADGVTRGGYSYIDSHGILQSVEYVADPIHGFRVAATNLPQDLPDVAYAKAKHLAEYEAIKAEHLSARTVQYTNPIAVPYASVPHIPQVQLLPAPVQDLPEVAAAKARHLAEYEAIKAQHLSQQVHPITPVQDLPEVVKARAEHLAAVEATKARNAGVLNEEYDATRLSPIPHQSGYVVPLHAAQIVSQPVAAISKTSALSYIPIISQYHAQDNHGQYSYGYTEPLSAKAETRTADGVTRGGYSYIDANGVLQTVHYVADPVNGFQVAATNLPTHHAATSNVVAKVVSHDGYKHTVHY